MHPGPCPCQSADCSIAMSAIRKAAPISVLLDDSHFIVRLSQCAQPGCGQRFLTMFCERVDWVDSDDPQSWIAVPVSEDEAAQLAAANIAADENTMLRIITGRRRFLYRDMPKRAPETLVWKIGRLHIPSHD